MGRKWIQKELRDESGLFYKRWVVVLEDEHGNKVTGVGENPEEAFKDAYQKADKGEYDSGCLLTTACVQWAGLPDDCRELTLIRRLRDQHLRRRPGGERLIAVYYALAPALIRRIRAARDAETIWARLLDQIRRTADLVEQDRAAEAAAFSWEVFRKLCRDHLGMDPGPLEEGGGV